MDLEAEEDSEAASVVEAASAEDLIIYVRNSTSNDDLIELFTTIGKVEQAEIHSVIQIVSSNSS
ncbi:hypothetical protein MY3296_010161 [Beauveria thailandica]